MKKRLNNIGPKNRHRFRGEFVRYGERDGWWSGNNVTVMLRDIRLFRGEKRLPITYGSTGREASSGSATWRPAT